MEAINPVGNTNGIEKGKTVTNIKVAEVLEAVKDVDEKERFLMELEFVQCLSNPYYLKYLADSRYLQDEAFIAYLKYLQYWKKPAYAKYIVYPQCLHFLELLQDSVFRGYCYNILNIEFIAHQQRNHWQFYRNNRLKATLEQQKLQQQQQQPQTEQSTATTSTNVDMIDADSMIVS